MGFNKIQFDTQQHQKTKSKHLFNNFNRRYSKIIFKQKTMNFTILPILVVGLAVFCHSLPFPQEEAENDIEPRYGVQTNLNNQNHRNPNNQNHRNPDRPRAPAPNPGPGCRIEYETIYEIIEDETFDQKCRTDYENRCRTRQRCCK